MDFAFGPHPNRLVSILTIGSFKLAVPFALVTLSKLRPNVATSPWLGLLALKTTHYSILSAAKLVVASLSFTPPSAPNSPKLSKMLASAHTERSPSLNLHRYLSPPLYMKTMILTHLSFIILKMQSWTYLPWLQQEKSFLLMLPSVTRWPRGTLIVPFSILAVLRRSGNTTRNLGTLLPKARLFCLAF